MKLIKLFHILVDYWTFINKIYSFHHHHISFSDGWANALTRSEFFRWEEPCRQLYPIHSAEGLTKSMFWWTSGGAWRWRKTTHFDFSTFNRKNCSIQKIKNMTWKCDFRLTVLILVAVQCLEGAFGLTDANYAFQPSKPLLAIFTAAEGLGVEVVFWMKNCFTLYIGRNKVSRTNPSRSWASQQVERGRKWSDEGQEYFILLVHAFSF